MRFFSKMNVLMGVYEKVKSLISRIGIQDSTVCANFWNIILLFYKVTISMKL